MPEDTDVPFKEYVDSQFAEVRRAVDIASQMPVPGVPLREYIEAIQHEVKTALDMAEREREKAAQVLREALAQAIDQGDRALATHIAQEIARIREALQSADLLERERVEKTVAKIAAVQRELSIVHEAAEKAIAKAENANEKRFASVNEFRAQLADQTASFLPREVADRQFAELARQLELAQRDRESKLPREVFDRTVAEWTAWRERIDAHVIASSAAERTMARTEDRQSVTMGQVIAAVSVGVAILGILSAIIVGSWT